MTIEYDIHCFERTLYITMSDKHLQHKEQILKMLDESYDEWQNNDIDTCLEEYMMEKLSNEYSYLGWDSIGWSEDDDYYQRGLHTWNDLYERADDKACGSPELRAKDEARWQLQEIIFLKEKVDIEEYESPEEAIDIFLWKSEDEYWFDVNGNFVKTTVKEN